VLTGQCINVNISEVMTIFPQCTFITMLSTLFEQQNWIVGHRWTFLFHRKKNNTQGLGEYKFLSCTRIQPFWSGKKFKILVPTHILDYSQCLILKEGNNTLYRWELMVWEGWKEHTYYVLYILLKVLSEHGTFTMPSWSSLPGWFEWASTA
jgi:hypothetical protein